MAITLAQVDAAIDAAFAAFTLGETAYTLNGRRVEFRSLTELQNHIDWLSAQKVQLTAQNEIDAGGGGAAVVVFQEPS